MILFVGSGVQKRIVDVSPFLFFSPHNKCKQFRRKRKQSCRHPECIRHFQPLTRVTVRGYMLNLCRQVCQLLDDSTMAESFGIVPTLNQGGCNRCLTSCSYKLADARDALIIDRRFTLLLEHEGTQQTYDVTPPLFQRAALPLIDMVWIIDRRGRNADIEST